MSNGSLLTSEFHYVLLTIRLLNNVQCDSLDLRFIVTAHMYVLPNKLLDTCEISHPHDHLESPQKYSQEFVPPKETVAPKNFPSLQLKVHLVNVPGWFAGTHT